MLRGNNALYEINEFYAFYAINEINEFYALRFRGVVIVVGRCNRDCSERRAERIGSAGLFFDMGLEGLNQALKR
jgi:hypothetical protein